MEAFGPAAEFSRRNEKFHVYKDQLRCKNWNAVCSELGLFYPVEALLRVPPKLQILQIL